MEIDGLTCGDTIYGVYVTAQNYFSLSNSKIGDVTQIGVYIVNSDNSSVTDCVVSSSDVQGYNIAGAENLIFTGNSIMDTGDAGIVITACDFAVIENNTAQEIFGIGLYVLGCTNSTVRFNEITMTLSDSITLLGCANATVSHNTVLDSNNYGILLDTCGNSTVFMNTVEETVQEGIYCYDGKMNVFDNTLTMIGASGIYLDNCPDSVVKNNDISMVASNYGIDVSDSPRSSILLNTLTECDLGMYLGNSDNASVIDNDLTDMLDVGLSFWTIEGLIVTGNTITNARVGILVDGLDNPSFANNVLTNCGFLLSDNLPIIYYNYSMSGNTVNGLPIYFGTHETSGTLNTDNYGQILLVNCSNFDITGGADMERVTAPIQLLHCDYVDVIDLSSMYNSYGVYLYASANITLSDSYIEGFLISGFSSFGVAAYNSYNLVIQDSIFWCVYTSGNERGVLDFRDCVDVDVINCEISFGQTGLYFRNTDNFTIVDSEILHFEGYGIRFSQNPAPSEYIHIERNLIYNATRGIYGDQTSEWMIKNNTIMHNSIYGIWCGAGDYGNITLNTIESNGYGVYISNADYYYIYENTIRWNGNGIYININSIGSLIWDNIIALSGSDNGYDDRSSNFWNVSTQGNSWDDFTPPAPYDVDGDTTDEHPTQYLPASPIIDQPMDFYYAEGSEGNEITWQPFDDSLSHWELWIGGVLWSSGVWDFVDVTVNVDGLDYGTHSGILTVWDVDQNYITDTVLIKVFDDTPPVINNVPNTEAFVDGTDQTLTWTVSDLHPDTYTVFVDDEEFASGTWTSGEIEINIDGLDEGVRSLRMVIRDIDGNSASDPVDVLVIADGDNPIIDSPSDLTYLEGETGNTIIWTPADSYPESFEVTSNGSVIVSGSWGGSRIALNVDGLQPGSTTFELTVIDGSGNEVSDTVRVTVLAIVVETTPPPPVDMGPILMVAGVAGAVVIVIVVIYLLKKRTSP